MAANLTLQVVTCLGAGHSPVAVEQKVYEIPRISAFPQIPLSYLVGLLSLGNDTLHSGDNIFGWPGWSVNSGRKGVYGDLLTQYIQIIAAMKWVHEFIDKHK